MTRPLRIAVIDDSPVACRALAGFLRGDPGVGEVVTTSDPTAAVGLVRATRPDAVTLDLGMPGLDGLEVLAGLFAAAPTPVVVVTGATGAAAGRVMRAVDLGAVDFLFKYRAGREADPSAFRRELVAKVRAAARVRVIGATAGRPPAPPADGAAAARAVVVVGASTGGPPAVRELLAGLPAGLPAAVLVVQHLPASFTPVFAAQLHRYSPLPVREAAAGDRLRPGVVLVAPGGSHVTVGGGGISLRPAGDELSPSVDRAMASAAAAFECRATGVLLSGIGADGVGGLVAVRAGGGRTFAQSPETCAAPGMPQRAVAAGVVEVVAAPAEIGRLVARLIGDGPPGRRPARETLRPGR